MNYRQANTLCRELCRKFDIRKAPHVIPLKHPHRFERGRFFNEYAHDVALGFNDQFHNTVELNRQALSLWNDSKITELLMHELAHKICYQRFQDYSGEHGERFEQVCKSLEFPDHIAKERM